MRKKGKVKKAGGLEAAAVRRNERVIQHADVAVLVVDASEPLGKQEKTLAGQLKDAGCAVIIVANKWDLIEEKTVGTMNTFRSYIAASIPFLKWAPVLFVSALTKQRVQNLFELIDEVETHRSVTIPEKQLEAFLLKAKRTHKPSKGKGVKPPTVLDLKQVSTKPPTFVLTIKGKRTDTLHPSYVRYLQNRLRDTFGLRGTPINIRVRTASVHGSKL